MPKHIYTTSRGSIIEFDSGKFDDWCVYVAESGIGRYAPNDERYFSRLKTLGERHGRQQIYDDFVVFYQMTDANLNPQVLQTIRKLSLKYGTDSHEIGKWFAVIYAGMVAEENKQFAILKKRIKRLGMHQVLVDSKSPAFAATFSRGRKWHELDALMKTKGF